MVQTCLIALVDFDNLYGDIDRHIVSQKFSSFYCEFSRYFFKTYFDFYNYGKRTGNSAVVLHLLCQKTYEIDVVGHMTFTAVDINVLFGIH